MNTISGKVIQILPEVSGVSERGEWIRGGLVVESITETDNRIAIEVFGQEKIEWVRGLSVGEVVIVDYRVTSRFHLDKWFTTAQLVRLMKSQKMEVTNVG